MCSEYRESDSNPYNCGGLARRCEETGRRKLLDRMNVFLQDPAKKFHEAATRLYMKIGYAHEKIAHDFFAADIFYHDSCYIKFTLKKIGRTVDETLELLESDVLEEFFLAQKERIVHEKDAFLLSDLVEDIKRLSELSRLTEPIILNKRTLERGIIDKFSDDISFCPKGKYLIVHNVDPFEYVLAILKGKGLKDYDITKSFGKLIRRKFKITAEEKQSPEWLYIPQAIVEMLDKGPLPEIYNTIFYTVYRKYVTNKYGYAKTKSSQFSTKI